MNREQKGSSHDTLSASFVAMSSGMAVHWMRTVLNRHENKKPPNTSSVSVFPDQHLHALRITRILRTLLTVNCLNLELYRGHFQFIPHALSLINIQEINKVNHACL
jgi:hypothetical protein